MADDKKERPQPARVAEGLTYVFGRPTKYDPQFCERVIEYGKEGMGRIEIAAELGVVRNTLIDWESLYPDFSNAMLNAEALSNAWWAAQGRKGIWSGSDFNANAYRLQVQNRFPDDWRDKQDVELYGKGGGAIKVDKNVDPDTIRRAIAEMLESISNIEATGII